MLQVFSDNPYGTDCWLLGSDDSDEAVVIDLGFEPDTIHAMLEAAGRSPAAVLLTHGHLDHATAAGTFAGDEVPVFIHPADALAFTDPEAWRSGSGAILDPVKDLRTFEDGDLLRLAGLAFRVKHTPGHTPGHCVFLADVRVFSGDLIFEGSIGRSDFPNSDPAAMRESLRWFLTLEDDLAVFPGHGPTTTVGRERTSNPFLREP